MPSVKAGPPAMRPRSLSPRSGERERRRRARRDMARLTPRRARGRYPRHPPETQMKDRKTKGIGLAIVGAGRVGLFRGEVAARHPAVEWIGIAEKNPNRGGSVAAKIGADFVTTDHRALLARPEATCAIIATDEHLHVDPIMCAI